MKNPVSKKRKENERSYPRKLEPFQINAILQVERLLRFTPTATGLVGLSSNTHNDLDDLDTNNILLLVLLLSLLPIIKA